MASRPEVVGLSRQAVLSHASGKERARAETAWIVVVVTLALAIFSLFSFAVARAAGIPASVGVPAAALCFHVVASIYLGDLRSWRRLTWLCLVSGLLVMQAAAFAGYIVPWGQFSYWLAARLAEIGFAEILWEVGSSMWTALALTVLVAIFALDINALHRRVPTAGRWTLLVTLALFAMTLGYAMAFFAAAACDQTDPFASVEEVRQTVECGYTFGGVLSPPDAGGLGTPAHIVPEWHVLPFFAVLRAVPDKLGGVVAVFAMLAIPILATWFGAERLRVGWRAKWWIGACVLMLATLVGLGWLGAQPPEGSVLLASGALALYLVLFPVIPFALRAMPRT